LEWGPSAFRQAFVQSSAAARRTLIDARESAVVGAQESASRPARVLLTVLQVKQQTVLTPQGGVLNSAVVHVQGGGRLRLAIPEGTQLWGATWLSPSASVAREAQIFQDGTGLLAISVPAPGGDLKVVTYERVSALSDWFGSVQLRGLALEHVATEVLWEVRVPKRLEIFAFEGDLQRASRTEETTDEAGPAEVAPSGRGLAAADSPSPLVFRRALLPEGVASTVRFRYVDGLLADLLTVASNLLTVALLLALVALLTTAVGARWRRARLFVISAVAAGGLAALVALFPFAVPSLVVASLATVSVVLVVVVFWAARWGWTAGRDVLLDMVLGPVEDEEEDEDEDGYDADV
jgi:hypothetical protein